MTNMTFGAISDYRDIEVLNHHREATTHLGHTDAEVLAALAPAEPRQRPHPRAVGRQPAWRLHHRCALDRRQSERQPINAAAQVDDPDSVYSFYRQVIALRHTEPVVAYGDFTMLLPDDEHVYAFTRSLPDAELLVLGNFSGSVQKGDAGDPAWAAATQVLGNYPSDGGTDLRPWEVRVLRRDL